MRKETIEEAAERLYPAEWDWKEKESFIEGAEWQQAKMYTEEDMKHAYTQGARLALISQSPLALHRGEFPTPEEWFNEFKKI